jgi:cytochrome c oxidase cbb3-type subunit 3
MSGKHEDPLTDHDYDGIQEYDNPLPMWWLATFLGAVIFGYIYWLHYLSGSGPTLLEEFHADMAAVQQLQAKQKMLRPADSLPAAGADESLGRSVFQSKCAVCHGPELQGSIGPNLTDDYWLYGQGALPDISRVVREGVPDKGMPAWESLLNANELNSVSAFVASASGTHPPNPKPPQGNKVGH